MECLRTLKAVFTAPLHRSPLRRIQPRYCYKLANAAVTSEEANKSVDMFKSRLSCGPSFQDFIKGVGASRTPAADGELSEKHDYLSEDLLMGNSRKGQ